MKKLLTALVTGLLAAGAIAYPDKPITIVVPFAAGGPTDKVARDLAEALRKPLNNAVVIIENVGGAGGTLEERRYYCQNGRADVSAALTSTGKLVEWVKY